MIISGIRKFGFIFALLLAGPLLAQVPQTPNLGLSMPPQQYPNWGPLINRNFTVLDTTIANLQNQWQGAWVSGTTYGKAQLASWNGGVYISLVNSNLNQQPDLSPGYWAKLSSQFTWQGTWASGTTYAIGDAVSYLGNSYVSTADGNTATPPSGAWNLFAQGGATGATGPQGSPGGSLSYPGVTTDSANGLAVAGGVAAATVGAVRYAQGYKTGGSCNGIAAAFAAAATFNLTVEADPAYCSTETYNVNASLFGPAQTTSHMIDRRNGEQGDFFRNPAINLHTNVNTAQYSVLQSDTIPQAMSGTSASTRTVLWQPQVQCASPGMSLGNPGFGPAGWTQCYGIYMTMNTYTAGLSEPFAIIAYKGGVGDWANYIYHYSYGGMVSPSDQGNNMLAINGGENNTTLKGTIATGGTGATTVTVNCTMDCAHPGDGRILFDAVPVSTGLITAITNPSGNTPGNFTVDQTYTPSTARGTMNGNCAPNLGAPYGIGGTSITCNVTMLAGTFAAGDQVCFGGTFWEQTVLTAATSTSITAPLRRQHASGTWAMANGPCGQMINPTSTDVTGTTVMHYVFQLLGATSANTLQWAKFKVGLGNNTSGLGIGTFAATNLNNIGGIVYLSTSGINANSPHMIGGLPSITISNATVSAYNGLCTNFKPTLVSATTYQCTQAGSVGAGNSAVGTLAWGTTANGYLPYSTYYGSEVLDVQDYSDATAHPKICPGNVCTFKLEPNPAATWTVGDAVELAHHYSLNIEAHHLLFEQYNTGHSSSAALKWSFLGSGISGGNSGSGTTFAVEKFINLNANSVYTYHGGGVVPPGGIMFANGLFNYGLAMINAPDPLGTSVIAVGCPASGCTDASYYYNIFSALGNGSTAALRWTPVINELSFSGVNLVLNSDLAAETWRDNQTASSPTTPVGNLPTTSTTGGNYADGVQRCFQVSVRNGAGYTPVSAEQCKTAGTSGTNTNSFTFTYSRVIGASVAYYVCAGASGAEQFAIALNGINSTTWVDTGSITPSGSCSQNGGIDTSRPSTNGWSSIGLNSATTSNNVTLKAASGLGSGITVTLPGITGTLALNTAFVASGASHAAGLVPDPGASAGTTKFLREDNTWAIPAGGSGGANTNNVPPWLKYLGDGSGGAYSCASGTCTTYGDSYYSSFNVSAGATLNISSIGYDFTAHVTGACTINGTIDARGVVGAGFNTGNGSSGTGGGGGGGTLVGAVGKTVNAGSVVGSIAAGTAGTASGGAGGNGTTTANTAVSAHTGLMYLGTLDGLGANGGSGGAGGSSGGAGGNAGSSVTLICGSISGTGTIKVDGAPGTDAPGNNTGAGGGGGGGTVILSSQTATTYGLTLTATGGAGGSCGGFTGCGVGGTGGAGATWTFSGW
jgi:hypothetical protein